MGREIERKFLVAGTGWQQAGAGIRIRQGYLSLDEDRAVRIREAGDRAWLTIKGGVQQRCRVEFEYPLPVADAREMLDTLCLQPTIDKTRLEVYHAGLRWEVDVFHGANEGLVLAELELERADQAFDAPSWLGEEVSDDPRYYNVNLVKHPYQAWPDHSAPAAPSASSPPRTSCGADPA